VEFQTSPPLFVSLPFYNVVSGIHPSPLSFSFLTVRAHQGDYLPYGAGAVVYVSAFIPNPKYPKFPFRIRRLPQSPVHPPPNSRLLFLGVFKKSGSSALHLRQSLSRPCDTPPLFKGPVSPLFKFAGYGTRGKTNRSFLLSQYPYFQVFTFRTLAPITYRVYSRGARQRFSFPQKLRSFLPAKKPAPNNSFHGAP